MSVHHQIEWRASHHYHKTCNEGKKFARCQIKGSNCLQTTTMQYTGMVVFVGSGHLCDCTSGTLTECDTLVGDDKCTSTTESSAQVPRAIFSYMTILTAAVLLS